MHAGPEQAVEQEELHVGRNMQAFILEHAARACEEPCREKFEGYVQKLVELVKARGHKMKPINVSSCLHRLSRTAVTYTNVGPLRGACAAAAAAGVAEQRAVCMPRRHWGPWRKWT